ncbi:phenylacetate-CoA ligase [Mycetocola sp. CAN_C7]|uniref:phenylacetate--CoA ligase family protein n=1 Tax=Mycetocola sp. CAN_C7 TaxID=2787724 RepID=UPI0018CBE0BD
MTARFASTAFGLKTRVAQRGIRAVDRSLRTGERLDPEMAARRQHTATMDLVRYAFDTTPFYRDRYREAGINRRDLFDPDIFESLPVVRKADLRERQGDFLAEGVPPSRRLTSATGGSTGVPVALLHDRRAPVAAMWWRVYRWWGIEPWEDMAFIHRERRTAATQRREALEWWPSRHLVLDSRAMSPASMEQFHETWTEVMPRLLNGYIGGVHEFASYVFEHSLSIHAPHAIGVTSAPITPSQRTFIESVLGAPVYDQYRTAEVPWIAAQCSERSALHVLSDLRTLEITDDDWKPVPPGTLGNVVITDLCNRVFPLIRYEIGDLTSIIDEPCACGMSLTRIAPISGRISDVLRLPSGLSVAGGLNALFNARPDAVRQFQIHQRADYTIALRYVKGDSADAESAVADAAERLAVIVEHAVPVILEPVEFIAHDRGKARTVVCDVAAPVAS